MLDMLFEIASTLFMATLAGFFIWFVLSDGNPIEHFKRRLNRNKPCLCDRCVFLNQNLGRQNPDITISAGEVTKTKDT